MRKYAEAEGQSSHRIAHGPETKERGRERATGEGVGRVSKVRISPLTVAGRSLWVEFHLYHLAEMVHHAARIS